MNGEVRLRASRKCGQLLKETEKAKGNRNDGKFGGRATRPPNKEEKTLAEMGISKDQSSKFQKLADVPDECFEEELSAPHKPSVDGILRSEPDKILHQQSRFYRSSGSLWVN